MTSYCDEIFINLAKNIKKYRMKAGYSQINLGLKLGRSSDYIAQIERGFRTPTLKSLCNIAKALNVEPYELLKFDE